MRIMGLPPQRIKHFEEFLIEIKPLLSGKESMMKKGEKFIPIIHIMQDKKFVNFIEKIPMYISGFGPKSLGLAGKYGDGAVLAFPSNAKNMEYCWLMIEEGAKSIGRQIQRDKYLTTALTAVSILDEGSTWFDAGTPDSLMQASQFVQSIQKGVVTYGMGYNRWNYSSSILF